MPRGIPAEGKRTVRDADGKALDPFVPDWDFIVPAEWEWAEGSKGVKSDYVKLTTKAQKLLTAEQVQNKIHACVWKSGWRPDYDDEETLADWEEKGEEQYRLFYNSKWNKSKTVYRQEKAEADAAAGIKKRKPGRPNKAVSAAADDEDDEDELSTLREENAQLKASVERMNAIAETAADRAMAEITALRQQLAEAQAAAAAAVSTAKELEARTARLTETNKGLCKRTETVMTAYQRERKAKEQAIRSAELYEAAYYENRSAWLKATDGWKKCWDELTALKAEREEEDEE